MAFLSPTQIVFENVPVFVLVLFRILGLFAFAPLLGLLLGIMALVEAKRWLRQHTDESGRRPFEHPYYWAAFVVVGDDR